jgi:hypothetical protein
LTTSTKNWPDAVTAFAGAPTTATSMFAAIAPANAQNLLSYYTHEALKLPARDLIACRNRSLETRPT